MGQDRINVWTGFKFDNPAQIDFLKSPAKYRLLSSGRGGGKSVVGCRESIRCALEFSGSRNMICRLKSTELEASTHVTFRRELRAIGLLKGEHFDFNQNKNTYSWFNGSETVLSHLEDEEKFGSVELSTIFVDEGSQVPDAVYQMIFPANLRWEVGPHRAWFCTNPGASGWLRDIVYGKALGSGKEVRHQRASGGVEVVRDEYSWFPVKAGMNQHNPGGQDYFDDLKRQGGRYGPHWLAKYHDGDWSSFEGQRFPMFDQDSHVLATPWKPTASHEVIEGWDFGHQVTHVCWIAFDPKGIEPVVVFDELEMREVDRPEDVANKVKQMRSHYGIADRVFAMGDPAGASSTQFSSVTVFGAYAALGVYIAPCKAGKDPLARADMIASHMTAQKRQPDGSYWPGILFGPNCTRTIHSVVNLRWDLSSNTKGEDPRERFVNKDKHGFDACLIPGTLVATAHGDVPIERIEAGDLVLTRNGYRPVARAWMTHEDADVMRVALSDGGELVGTPDHLIYSNGRFRRLDSLAYGDILLSCQNKSTSTGFASTATPIHRTAPSASTSPPTCTTSWPDSSGFTRKSGEPLMEAFPTGTTSTTSTATLSTTIWATSPASTPRRTRTSTSTMLAASRCERSPLDTDRSPRLGTLLMKDGPGTSSTADNPGSRGGRASMSASGAGRGSNPPHSATTSASAQDVAPPPSAGPAEWTTRTAPVDAAAPSTASTATRELSPAPVHVVSIYDGGHSPVYDLAVDEDHEFFANGVLVHNCGYGMVGVPPPEMAPPPRPRDMSLGVGGQTALKEWAGG